MEPMNNRSHTGRLARSDLGSLRRSQFHTPCLPYSYVVDELRNGSSFGSALRPTPRFIVFPGRRLKLSLANYPALIEVKISVASARHGRVAGDKAQ
jgi:hypothetical protein